MYDDRRVKNIRPLQAGGPNGPQLQGYNLHYKPI